MNDKRKLNPTEALYEWFKRIQVPHDEIGGFAVCPYSKSVRHLDLIEISLSDLVLPKLEAINKILVYRVEDEATAEQMEQKCQELSNKDIILLADHKDRNTYINGIQTNNGYYNFILCQPVGELNDARRKLLKTKYYDYWDKEYMKEIFGEYYGMLD